MNQKMIMYRNGAWIITALITLLSVWVIETMTGRNTGGLWMYPLDDPFIHMQIARNLAQHGTWGINPGEFGSASSSIFYTLLLALSFKIFSVHALIPFILNMLAAVLLLFVADRWLSRNGCGFTCRLISLSAVIVFMPLPILVISGMEHIFQALFAFLFLVHFSEWMGNHSSEKNNQAASWKVLVFAVLVVLVRFEGLFLIIGAGILLLWNRKWKSAFLLLITGSLPILIFGIISLSHGSFFFPNSVVLKAPVAGSSLHQLPSVVYNILVDKLTIVKGQSVSPAVPPPGISLLTTQRLLLILPLVYLFFKKWLPVKKQYQRYTFLLLIVTVAHLAFASTGWFYRYEAYLLFCTMMILAILVKNADEFRPRFIFSQIETIVAGLVFLFAIFFPAFLRTTAAYTKASRACVNIYGQQYQMARFIKQNADIIKTVAVNDIGAVSFYNESRVIDLWGLADIDIAKSKINGYDTPRFTDSLVKAEHVDLLMVYDSWFPRELLDKWEKLGSWTIQDNVILGGDTVSFYTCKNEDIMLMKQRLKDFEKELPPSTELLVQP